MTTPEIRPQDIDTADCLLEKTEIGAKHIRLHFAEIYRTDAHAFVENVLIDISGWQQFHGTAYHAKTGRYRTVAENRIEPLESVSEYVFSDGILTLKGSALLPSGEWLEYTFRHPAIRITQRREEAV